jgi:hypothetical protein
MLYAWALAFGLLVAVPLIIHLRRRETSRRIPFPALRYLTRAEDARSRSLRASDVLLLATRLGLLLLLALAAAGPLLGRGGAADHRPTDVAILIDNSASAGRLAGGRPLVELFVDRARQTLSAGQPADRFWIQPLLGPPLATGANASRAIAALDRVQPSGGGADLGEAVARATAFLPASEGRGREVHLLSDLQRSALPPVGAAPAGGAVPIVAFAPPVESIENGAIGSVQLSGGSTVPSGFGQTAIVRVQRFPIDTGSAPDSATDAALDSVAGAALDSEATLRLELDGQTAGGARAPWGSVVTIGLPELSPGVHLGRVEIEPDGLRADDERHFAVHVVEPPTVERSGPEGSFLGVGIETLRQAGRLGSGRVNVRVIEGAPVGDPGDAGDAETLVMVPPLDPVELPAFNQLLARLGTGWTAELDPGRGEIGIAESAGALRLEGVAVHRRYLLRPLDGAVPDTILLEAADGEPWLIRSQVGGHTFLVLGSALDPAATDLPASPAMIPFLEALLVRWSHLATWPLSDFEAGNPFALPAWADSIRGTDGSWTTVEPGAPFTALETGVYFVSGTSASIGPPAGRAGRTAAFAVNIPLEELDLEPLPADSLSELFPDREVITAGPDEGAWERAIFRARRGRDVASWLLLLAIGIAATELVLATPGRAASRR